MAEHSHVRWLKEGVLRWNRRRKKVQFSPDLSGVNFFDLLPDDFRDDPKTSRTFEKIDLSDANLESADLSGLNFQKSSFRRANLSSADLSLSNFNGANFERADLSRSNGSNSTFINARFERARLTKMELEGAELENTIFIATNLTSDQRLESISQAARFFASADAFQKYAQRLMDYQTSYDRGSEDSRKIEDERVPKNKYDVFFGTNRGQVIERGALVGFDGSNANEISYGVCEVIVPESRKIGSLGSPLFKRLLNLKDDRLKLDCLISLNQELFFEHLKATAQRMKLKERPTIFVHGFNNSFEDAVLRTAQIGYDLRIGQGAGLFSWPSKGKKREYSSDEASAEASKYLLADFIELFVENSHNNSINVIAHSMGCRCLLGAFEVLSNGRKSVLRKINQVILAAADVDAAIMPNLGQSATSFCTRTTSYVSDKDKALKLSGWLHSFPRVGFAPPTYILNGMDTVLVNNDDLGILSHGYIGSSRTVLNDIFWLLKNNVAPSHRFSLETVDGKHWRIRE